MSRMKGEVEEEVSRRIQCEREIVIIPAVLRKERRSRSVMSGPISSSCFGLNSPGRT